MLDNLPLLLSDTVGFIRKLPHGIIESFKSTLDEVREADILIHVVDISHPEFEEQINVVRQTLSDIGASEKKTIFIFNKIDDYTFIEKEADDLSPATKENFTLEELKNTWMAKDNTPSIFISAKTKQNLSELKDILYQEVKDIHRKRFPYEKFLY